MRISNCSRESLSMNAARLTVYFRMSMGKGTGPMIVALWRAAVSVICFTDLSRMPCSYARTLMRRRCDVSAFFGARAGVGTEATEESTAGLAATLTVRVRGFTPRAARTFFTVFSAVIDPAEYAPSPSKLQRLFLGKIGPEGQD